MKLPFLLPGFSPGFVLTLTSEVHWNMYGVCDKTHISLRQGQCLTPYTIFTVYVCFYHSNLLFI